METVIRIADLQSIYSVAEVDRALGDGAAQRNEGLKSWYDRMRELGGSRYIIKPSTTAAVDDLCETSPNFVDVVDDLRKYLALAVAGNEAVQFTPMLLLGESGSRGCLTPSPHNTPHAGPHGAFPPDLKGHP